MENIKILYVDDELNNLSSFKAAFRFEYKILAAKSAEEALNHLSQHHDVHIVICDYRMPGKTGVDILEEIRYKYPKPVRMLLTGYADIEPIIEAINRGHIFRFIKKPWNEIDIRSAIDEGIKYQKAATLLTKKNEELQAAYNLLDEFSFNVTHGLRDPILSVLSLIEIAQNMDNVNDDVKEILEMVGHAMIQLDSFIENTRDYHQLKQNNSEITGIWFKDILEYIKDEYQHESAMNDIKFTHSVSQNAPFNSNETMLRIVINNLLSNAFKYQKKKATDKFIDLKIIVESEAAAITVEDNGIGISPEHIKNIFDPMYRATSHEYGSGMGLFNVRDVLQKLDGTITVESDINIGSTFKVIIPSKKTG